MDLVLVVLLIAVIGGAAAVATGRLRGGLAPVHDDLAPPLDDALRTPEDLDRVRFTVGLRGYRMDQVDAVLDEARDLLAAKDSEVRRLRQRLEHAQPGPPAPTRSEGTTR